MRRRRVERGGLDFIEGVVLGKVRGVVLLEGEEDARLDVRALVLVREVEGGVELREAGCSRTWYSLEQSVGRFPPRTGRVDVSTPAHTIQGGTLWHSHEI